MKQAKRAATNDMSMKIIIHDLEEKAREIEELKTKVSDLQSSLDVKRLVIESLEMRERDLQEMLEDSKQGTQMEPRS